MDHTKRVDNCVKHVIEYVPAGFGIGLVLSFVAFKKQRWPILLSTGFAIGLAVTNCEYEIYHKEYLPPCDPGQTDAKPGGEKKPGGQKKK